MDRINFPISQSSFHKIGSRRHKAWLSILALLVMASIACADFYGFLYKTTEIPSSGRSAEFIAFSNEDCYVGGSFPAPDLGTMQIYPYSIYCPFMTGGKLHGVVDLTIDYVVDPAKSDYADDQKIWNEKLQQYDNIEGARNYSLLKDPPTQSVIVVIPDTEKGAQEMNAELSDLILYKGHFIILVDGTVTVSSEADAAAIDLELIRYAEATADNHYK
jgi:hypothetical protein